MMNIKLSECSTLKRTQSKKEFLSSSILEVIMGANSNPESLPSQIKIHSFLRNLFLLWNCREFMTTFILKMPRKKRRAIFQRMDMVSK